MEQEEIIAFFNRYAPTWNENMRVDEKKMERILEASRVYVGKAVLDIGCGTGVMLPYYLKRGASFITAVDISPEMTKIAKESFGHIREIEIITADAQSELFCPCYDVCMVFNALPHFSEPNKLMENIHRSLKKGGVVCVCHDRGREQLKQHHSGEVKRISNPPVSGEALKDMLFHVGFTHISVWDEENIFIVTGEKE